MDRGAPLGSDLPVQDRKKISGAHMMPVTVSGLRSMFDVDTIIFLANEASNTTGCFTKKYTQTSKVEY